MEEDNERTSPNGYLVLFIIGMVIAFAFASMCGLMGAVGQ